MVTKEESVKTDVETEETKTEETSKGLDESSESQEETSAESTEKKSESEKVEEGTESESKEEDEFQQQVTSLAQSIANKTTKTLEKQRNEWRQKAIDAEAQLNERAWNNEIAAAFKDDTENLGEDEANKRKANRERLAAQAKKFDEDAALVKGILPKIGKEDITGLNEILETLNSPTLSEGINMLGSNLRNLKAKEEVWTLLFPEDAVKIKKVNLLVKRFETAENMKDFDLILGGIKASLKQKPYKPDSGRNSGSGFDFNKLSREAKDKIIAQRLQDEKPK